MVDVPSSPSLYAWTSWRNVVLTCRQKYGAYGCRISFGLVNALTQHEIKRGQ